MSASIAYPTSAVTTANGTTSGYLTFASTTGFAQGAYAWLTMSDNSSQMLVQITAVTPTTVGVVKQPYGLGLSIGYLGNYGRSDVSAYPTGSLLVQWGPQVVPYKSKKKSTGPSYYFTLTANLLSNSRATPAFQDTLGNGTQMLLLGPGVTRVEPNGFLNENPATNTLYYSQLIGYNDGTNGWTLDGGGTSSPATATTNSADVVAPDGTQTATKLTFSTVASGGDQSRCYQAAAIVNGSCWLRTLSGTATVYLFSPAGGSVACSVTTTWQRFSFNAASTGYFVIGGQSNQGCNITACTVYAWGAQSEAGAFPTSYFPTNTNEETYSNALGSWTDENVTLAQNVASPLASAGFGATSAWTLTCSAATGYHRFYDGGSCIQRCRSLYAKAGTVGFLSITGQGGAGSVVYNLNTGTIDAVSTGTGAIQSVGGGWYRCIFDQLIVSAGTFIVCVGDTAAHALGPGTSWTAAGTETVYVFGAQSEASAGPYPSSYFDTGSSITTTRALDVLTFSNPLHGIDPPSWSFGATLTPIAGDWYNVYLGGGSIPIWWQGGNQLNPSTWRTLIAYPTTTGSEFDVYDQATNSWDIANTGTVSGGAPVTISCKNQYPGITSTSPGTPGTHTGTGTGIVSVQPATITLGYGSDVYNFIGWISNVWMDKDNTLTVSKLSLFLNGVVPSAAIGAGTLLTDQGVAVTNVRATPAFCDVSSGNDYSSMKLLGPNTLNVEGNGLRVEGAVQNYIAYSQLIGAAGWLPTGMNVAAPTVTINSSDVMAPDGTQTASKLDFPTVTASDYSVLYQGPLSSTGAISVWLRTLTGTATVYLSDFTNSGTNYTTCNVTTTWQRFVLATGTNDGYFSIGFDPQQGVTPAGGPCTVYAWGAQAENTAFATSYFPTDTNTIINSQTIAPGPGLTLTSNNNASWDGTNTASLITCISGNSEHRSYIYTSGTTVPYTQSMYVKDGNGQMPWLWVWDGGGNNVQYNVALGAVVQQTGTATGQMIAMGNGWYRLVYTTATANVQGTIIYNYANAITVAPGVAWTAAGTETTYQADLQNEFGTQPSSRFITGASLTTTRAADYPSVPSPYAGLSSAAIPTWRYGVSALPLGTWSQVFGVSSTLACFLNVGENNNANCTRLELVGSSASQLDMYDSADANRLVNASSGPSGSAKYTLEAYGTSSVAGTLTIPGAGSHTGVGSGIVSVQPATVHLGQFGNNITTYPIWGWLTNIYIDQGPVAPVVITLAPTSATLTSYGATQTFTPTITGRPVSPTTGTWSNSGTGSVNGSGVYTAPSDHTTSDSVTFTLTATGDTKSAAITLSTPIVVSVSPSSATAGASASVSFTASYTGSGSPTLTWSDGGAGGSFSPTTGASTTYTTPSSFTSVTVTCTPNTGTAGTSTVTYASGPPKPSSNKVSGVLTSWAQNAMNSVTGGQSDPDGGNNAYKCDYQSSSGAALTEGTIGVWAPTLGQSVTFYMQVKNQGSSPMSFIIGGFFSTAQRQDFTIPNDGAWHTVGATWTANAADVANGGTVLLGNGIGGNAYNSSFTGGVFYMYDVEFGPT